MKANDPYICKNVPRTLNAKDATPVLTLENLLNRVIALKAFRKDIKTFLELVHQRELVLKQMHLAVESIQSDTFFISEEDLEAKKAFVMDTDKARLAAEVNA